MADQATSFAQPPSSTNTSGLTLPVENLTAISGNPTGSDSESPGRAQLTLRTDVLFKFAKSNLTPKAKTVLSSVAQQIKSRARGTVQVTGYTDSIGTRRREHPALEGARRGGGERTEAAHPGHLVRRRGQGLGRPGGAQQQCPTAPTTRPGGRSTGG